MNQMLRVILQNDQVVKTISQKEVVWRKWTGLPVVKMPDENQPDHSSLTQINAVKPKPLRIEPLWHLCAQIDQPQPYPASFPCEDTMVEKSSMEKACHS